MNIHRIRNRGKSTPLQDETDAEERFVVSRCCLYLSRLLSRYPKIDEYNLRLSAWLLGPQVEIFTDDVSKYIGSKENFADTESMESCLDTDLGEILHEMFIELNKRKRLYALKKLIALLKMRFSELSELRQNGLWHKIETLREAFALTDNETEYCIFQLIVAGWSFAYDYFDFKLDINDYKSRSYLLAALNLKATQLDEILNGTLRKIGLVEFSGMDVSINSDTLELFIHVHKGNVPTELFAPLSETELPIHHHLVGRKQTEHVLSILGKKMKKPCHLLIYGPPGTGKSSFAQSLSQQIKAPFYEITKGDEKNASSKRRAAICVCLNMTNMGSGSVVVVDEADGILNTGLSWIFRGESQDKGWLNDLLEKPGVRMVWITNDISGIEESVKRRFTYSLQFKRFTRRQRITLWNNILEKVGAKNRLTETDIGELAVDYKISAAAIADAVKTASQLRKRSSKTFRESVEMTLEAHQSLLRGGAESKKKNTTEKDFSLEGLNTDADLAELVNRISVFTRYKGKNASELRGTMRLLFYGPPGTGKSELARYLAQKLSQELLVKQSSDLFNAYVGGTEANIRDAFEEAEADEAILVIDEVDSFLFNRERTVRSWEVSFINEFLSQMERFNGILVGTTNRMADLDHAASRRFNHKVEFRYLSPEGKIIFYDRLLAPLANKKLPEKELKSRFTNITPLAPGDFRIVRDQFAFFPSDSITHSDLLGALEAEAKIRNFHSGQKPIGFR